MRHIRRSTDRDMLSCYVSEEASVIRKIATIVPFHEKTRDNKELSRSHQINQFERELERRSSTHPSLDHVYREQMEFVRFHNGLVWQVSTVFVPFSLAGLALDFEDDYGMIDHLQLWFVAIGSIVTIVVWAILAEWHRWLWVNSLHIAKIIEAKWGYRGKPEIPGLWDTLGLSANPPAFLGVEAARHDWGRLTRLSIVLLVVLIWDLPPHHIRRLPRAEGGGLNRSRHARGAGRFKPGPRPPIHEAGIP